MSLKSLLLTAQPGIYFNTAKIWVCALPNIPFPCNLPGDGVASIISRRGMIGYERGGAWVVHGDYKDLNVVVTVEPQ